MRVNWTEDEIRLLLSFYQKMNSGDMHKGHPLVIEASQALRNLPINYEYSENDPKFRNPNGIALKLANFLFLDPNYSGKGMKGCSVLDKKIFNEINMTDFLKIEDIDNKNTKYDLEKLIIAFIALIPEMEIKGSPMGQSNPFNGLAHEFNISYAGSKIKEPQDGYLNTSPIISFGLGRFSEVPWIVFTAHDQEVMNGIYPVILFYLEQKIAFLCFGVSETNTSEIQWNTSFISGLKKVSDILPSTNKYKDSFVHSTYSINKLSSNESTTELTKNLKYLIENFHQQFNNMDNIAKENQILPIHSKNNQFDLNEFTITHKLKKFEANNQLQKMLIEGEIEIVTDETYKIKEKNPSINITSTIYNNKFPDLLIEWGANKKSAVRIPFDSNSGRPIKDTIKNKLIETIDSWVDNPERISNILLIGGPGNGKTDALEYIIMSLIDKYSLDKTLVLNSLNEQITQNKRKLIVEVNKPDFPFVKIVAIPEASTGAAGMNKENALADDFINYLSDPSVLYISCINRGVLEDLKFLAEHKNINFISELISSISSSIRGKGLETWPLVNNDKIGVWFMDIDSMFLDFSNQQSPASQIMSKLCIKEQWDWYENFPIFMNSCPFYSNFISISDTEIQNKLNTIFYYFELISESKMNFRNYFSFISSLFASNNGISENPVKFSIDNLNIQNSTIPKERDYIKSTLMLMLSSYQLRLFREWEETFGQIINSAKDLDIGLLNNLVYALRDKDVKSFVFSFQSEYEKRFVKQLTEALDPFYSESSEIVFITECFSLSMADGVKSIENTLSLSEKKFFHYLILLEEELKKQQEIDDNNNKIIIVIGVLRVFGAKLASRLVGTKNGHFKNGNIVSEYSQVLEDFQKNKKSLSRRFKKITESKLAYPIHSFGQPKLNTKESVMIEISSSSAFNLKENNIDFKRSSYKRLYFENDNGFVIPLGYNLFKALKEMEDKLDINSIDSNVISLIERMESLMYAESLKKSENFEDLKLSVEGNELKIEDITL